MNKKLEPQDDFLRGFFESQWETALSNENDPASPDFSAAVLKKIALNKRRERLFQLGCVLIAISGVAALLLFVYPGYEKIGEIDFSGFRNTLSVSGSETGVAPDAPSLVSGIIQSVGEMFRSLSGSTRELGNSLGELFDTAQKHTGRSFVSVSLLGYLAFLVTALLGLDRYLRKYRRSHKIRCF